MAKKRPRLDVDPIPLSHDERQALLRLSWLWDRGLLGWTPPSGRSGLDALDARLFGR